MDKTIVAVCGPTASGKTALAVELALALDGEVVSADSMQVYRRMDIGTAKPAPEEMRGIPHHMLDVARPEENYSVGRYVSQAVPIVDDILRRGKLPVVAGGTGLYLDALIAGREFAPRSPLREELAERVRREGLSALYQQLENIDPQAAGRIHPNDEKRVLRALEVWYSTGKTITQHDQEDRQRPPRFHALRVGLSFADRNDLYARIDQRVEEMFERGLTEEVEGLLRAGVPESCTSMQAIGYKQLAAALREGRPVQQAKEEIKLRTRQYAKRQLTWLRREQSIFWHLWKKTADFSHALRRSTEYLHANGIG